MRGDRKIVESDGRAFFFKLDANGPECLRGRRIEYWRALSTYGLLSASVNEQWPLSRPIRIARGCPRLKQLRACAFSFLILPKT